MSARAVRVSAKYGARFRGACVGLGVAAFFFGCEFVVQIPDVTLLPGDGGLASLGPCGSVLPDGGLRSGPTMVKVDAKKGSYCIDTTEVTVADFNAYVLASGAHIDTPAPCATAIPPPLVENDPNLQNHPVGTVGVCDAWSYCRWAGKRLCSAIGGDGGTIFDTAQPIDTEWYYACVNGELNTAFPYGETYDPSACNTEGDGSVPVGSMTRCHGTTPPFDQIYDMSGNESEFVNDINGPEDPIASRGGSWNDSSGAACASVAGANGYVYDFEQTGFRCCADP